ncbi:MAG TPA: GNAT family protein [Bacteroidota bacterium]|nr:GNAT family protein [Bacteroidota bacterium]
MKIDIRPVIGFDQKAFITAVQSSRRLHYPWVSPPSNPATFKRYLEKNDGITNFGFVVFLPSTGQLVGVVNLTNVVYGLFRSGYLSYYAFTGFERQGYMQKGLLTVVRYAFTKLKLHRLEANIQPGNVASIKLIRKCGFTKEGFSPLYLKIGGRWRDHERWALVCGVRRLQPNHALNLTEGARMQFTARWKVKT